VSICCVTNIRFCNQRLRALTGVDSLFPLRTAGPFGFGLRFFIHFAFAFFVGVLILCDGFSPHFSEKSVLVM
jgi:hypothetical protein